MGRFTSALMSGLAVSGVTVFAQAPAPAPPQSRNAIVTAASQTAARNLIAEVSTLGCIRLWKPAPDDPAKMPPDRQPGLAGIYLLTPLSSDPTATTDLPTYLLTPSGTVNFSQHVGHTVEITGTSQTAPPPSTVQDLVTAPPRRPEEKPSTDGMPRLTVKTMKMVTESCP